MLNHYKERYSWLFRIIVIAIICLFAYNDTAFALAPTLRVTQKQFNDEYVVGYTKLAHAAINNNIRSKLPSGGIAELASAHPEDIDDTETIRIDDETQKIIFVAIADLAKDTGQLAHIGLGSQVGIPVIYVDRKYFNNASLRNHEKNKIARWEAKRQELKISTYSGMREWILNPATHGEARRFADQVDKETEPSVKKICGSIKGFVDLDNIYTLYHEYGLDKADRDINIAAHHKEIPPLDRSDPRRKTISKNWIEENIPELKGKTVFSLSMEGNIPEFAGYEARNANTRGGLGAYFGDKLEGMAAIGINAIGAQIGYSHVRKDGKKVKVAYDGLIKKGILEKVFVDRDAIKVRAWDEDPEARTEDEEDRYNPQVRVEVYKLNRGGATDYIFMSKVFDELYPDDRVHRFTQEIVFGKAVYAFMKEMGLKPDILHLNEAHTVVAAAQMRADEEYNKTAIVYTNHTLVPSGLETFHPASVCSNVDRMMYVIGLPKKKAAQLRSAFLRPDGVVDFCYAAIKLADIINAVSKEHALATKKLFREMYGNEFNAEVVGELNGSGQTWKSDKLIELESEGRRPDTNDAWAIHESGKAEAFDEIENRTGVKLDPNKPTAWAVRRLVDYKSQYPMLKFIVHLMTADKTRTFTREELKEIWFRDITNFRMDYDRNYFNIRDIAESVLNKIFPSGTERVKGLGMQVVVGWPEPTYRDFEAAEFYKWMDLPELKGKFVAVVSDSEMLKMQAIGADICITMPKPLEEACGTSDQRTGLNFGVNIAIKGAGPAEWIEEYDEEKGSGSGFFIGSYTKLFGDELAADNEKFYREAPADIFEKAVICSRLFYEAGKPKWKKLMLDSYMRANDTVTAVAMEKRYARDVYLPAIRKKRSTKTIYEIALRDYCDPKEGVSGLKSAMKELPFLAESGVKYVYLLGLMENTGSPFEIINPKNIDKHAGSFEELEEFIQKAHRLGLMVVMDWIANQHVSKTSPLCKQHPERFLYTNVSDGNYRLEKGPKLFLGRAFKPDDLDQRIKLGRKILDKLKNTDPKDLKPQGTIKVDDKKIPYHIADEEIRKRVVGKASGYMPIIIEDDSALFLVSATDLVSLKTDSPHRWGTLAQPDLSHPDVIKDALEAGRFWLGKSIEGIRINEAIAVFPDRIKENWNIEVNINLATEFIKEMRKINPYTFFILEGYERYKDLLAVADGRDAAVYGWECRNCATEALANPYKVQTLISYLRKTEMTSQGIRDDLIYLGPEHYSFDFGDPWTTLGFQDRNLLYFIYTFMPGYNLVFNGEIYGSQHKYSDIQERSAPAPLIDEADPAKKEIRRKLFSLPALYRKLIDGEYHYLETDNANHAIGLARFGDDEILIGALNVTLEDGPAIFDMKRMINIQVEHADMKDTLYVRDGLRLSANGTEWIKVEEQIIGAGDLFKYGLNVDVGPKGCEFIRLRKVQASLLADRESDKTHAPGHVATFFDLLTGKYKGQSVPFNALQNEVTVGKKGEERIIAGSTARKDLSKLVSTGLFTHIEGDSYRAAVADDTLIKGISAELSKLKSHATTVEVQAIANRYFKSHPSLAPPAKLSDIAEKKAEDVFMKFSVTCREQLKLIRQYNETDDKKKILQCAEVMRNCVENDFSASSLHTVKLVVEDTMQISFAMGLMVNNKDAVTRMVDEAEAAITELEKLSAAGRLLDAKGACIRSGLLDAALVLGDKEKKRKLDLAEIFNDIASIDRNKNVLPLRWEKYVSAEDLIALAAQVRTSTQSGIEVGIFNQIIFHIVCSSLDIYEPAALKPLGDLMIVDLAAESRRSHAREFAINFDTSGKKSKKVFSLLIKIQKAIKHMPDSAESVLVLEHIQDCMDRCSYLLSSAPRNLAKPENNRSRRSPEYGSPAKLLKALKEDTLFAKAMDRKVGASLEGIASANVIELIENLGILIPIEPGASNYCFGNIIRGKYDDDTKTFINALKDINWSLPIADLRELVKMTIMNEMEKEFTVPEGKTMYHIIERDVIPAGQRSTIIQAVNNKFYRDNKDKERILILNEKQSIADVIADIRAKDANTVIDVALGDESHIGLIDDKNVKKMVFEAEGEFIDLEGVLKALRALHYENADETLAALLRIYSVMAGQPPRGNLPIVSGVYVFKLPRIKREDINSIPKLNQHLLQLLTAA